MTNNMFRGPKQVTIYETKVEPISITMKRCEACHSVSEDPESYVTEIKEL